MENRIALPWSTLARSYIALTKPGILFGNAVTALGGFALASSGRGVDLGLLLATLQGLCLIMASGCVLNNYIDREKDKQMMRTRNRPLAKGTLTAGQALVFGSVLGVCGVGMLSRFTNAWTVTAALLGLVVYVFWYSFAKYRTVHGTLIGSIAGAVPPVVGYCAVQQKPDLAAAVLFAIVVLWQMPHFYAIAIYRMRDYAAASIPVLPIVKGMRATKIQMALYIIAFTAACCALTLLGYAGKSFLVSALLLGGSWLLLGLRGFKCVNDAKWARAMFFFSLGVILIESALLWF